ncbi:hypothetical protein [Kistimonas asteriae]|uniref:hypothetical protein n=1 Tax=Kistimonas asteriae TaxID=517724 RepID=UPI001BA90298|nr:hypothetical protein [Kistimonas asteriae]
MSSTADFVEEIKIAIARKHKFILSDDDPVLAIVTLNDLLLNHHLAQVNGATDKLREDIEAVTERHSLENRELAKNIINKSISHSVSEIKKVSDTLVEQLNTQQQSFLRDYEVISDNNQKLKTISAICAALSVIGALVTAGLVLLT